MTPFLYQKIVHATWSLVEKQGLRDVNAESIAVYAGATVLDVKAILPDQVSIVLILVADVLAKIHLASSPLLSEHDQLFDAMMQGFDAAEPHKMAIQNLWNDIGWKPWIWLQLVPAFQKKLKEIRISLPKKDKIWEIILNDLALQAIFMKVFLTWIEDETLDLSKTMADLDLSLKQYQEFHQYFV